MVLCSSLDDFRASFSQPEVVVFRFSGSGTFHGCLIRLFFIMILYVILLSLSFVHLVLGQCLSSQYTVLPIENVTVDDPNVRRGVALSVGTPPQNLAFGLVQ